MSKSIFGIVGFVLGAAAGSLVTWKLIEKKYADIADEEVASVKEMYARKNDTEKMVECTKPVSVTIEDKEESEKLNALTSVYVSSNDKPDYTAYSQVKSVETDTKPSEPEEKHDAPYVIEPGEFGEFTEYEQIELTYYKDDVICENSTDMIDPEDILGDIDVADHFGEYENDRVFVRDDRRMVDYEILRDERTFMEAI